MLAQAKLGFRFTASCLDGTRKGTSQLDREPSTAFEQGDVYRSEVDYPSWVQIASLKRLEKPVVVATTGQ